MFCLYRRGRQCPGFVLLTTVVSRPIFGHISKLSYAVGGANPRFDGVNETTLLWCMAQSL